MIHFKTGAVIIFILYMTGLPLSQANTYKMTRQEYINEYALVAIKEMKISGVPASITLAQGILESGDGNSWLAKKAKNHFGIKCHGEWEGKKVFKDDDEKNECFRSYPSVFDSYRDHSEFLKTRSRYAFLFELKTTDYKGWAKGLKKAGYATNPQYATLLIRIIEENQLYRFDTGSVETIAIKPATSISPDETEKVIHFAANRKVFSRNRIKYIIANAGDTYMKITNDLDMMPWQILKYNDLEKTDEIKAGDIIYLQPKRKKAKKDHHIVEAGETMRTISQKYGIKLKSLYCKNRMKPGSEPAAGQKLWLRKKKSK